MTAFGAGEPKPLIGCCELPLTEQILVILGGDIAEAYCWVYTPNLLLEIQKISVNLNLIILFTFNLKNFVNAEYLIRKQRKSVVK